MYLPRCKGKTILFKSIHTIIDLKSFLRILVVLPFHSNGKCMNLCQYSMLTFSFPKSNLCLGYGHVLCRYSQSLAKTAFALWWVLLLQTLCQSLPPANKVLLVCGCMNRVIKSINTVTSECITVYCWCKSV